MTLTKAKALDWIANKKALLKDLEAKQKQLSKLAGEVIDQEYLYDLVEDAIIYKSSKGPFPLVVDKADDTSFEVIPVCNVDRCACYELDMADGMWAVYAVNSHEDEVEIARVVGQRNADQIAKEFVSTGKKPKVKAC